MADAYTELPPDGNMVPFPNTWEWRTKPGGVPGHYARNCCMADDGERTHKPDCRWFTPNNPDPMEGNCGYRAVARDSMPISDGDVRKVLGKPLKPKMMFVYNDPVPTPEAGVIVNELLPTWLDLFMQNNAKYKDVDQSLGACGVFPDINRKVGVLKARVWNGQDTPGEPTEEVIQDLIGHLFLMWALMREEQGEGR